MSTMRSDAARTVAEIVPTIQTLRNELDSTDYLADEGMASALFCAIRLPQPLLLEGEAGVGKTEAAKAIASLLGTPLIRLQCYEGIDCIRSAVRMELSATVARDPGRRGRRSASAGDRSLRG